MLKGRSIYLIFGNRGLLTRAGAFTKINIKHSHIIMPTKEKMFQMTIKKIYLDTW